MGVTEEFVEIDAGILTNIFGQYDVYAKKIEEVFEVTIISRNDCVKIIGNSVNVAKAKSVLLRLAKKASAGNEINEQVVDYAISLCEEGNEDAFSQIDSDLICHTINGRPVKPKTLGQKEYVDLIREKMIVFGVGPAGTGKTYLAMAMAVKAFKENEVERIILTRPAIEAGEKLGFLPGDLQSKVDPYLRPLYDALNQIMGPESYMRNFEKGLIEVAPLAYMRGRTLDNAFIILDESQNTTPAQMKMFLTRIGFGSKVIVTGDLTQKDLPYGQVSGLEHSLKVLQNIKEIGVARLTNLDVVRHPLVQKIVNAYDEYDRKNSELKRKNELKKNNDNRKSDKSKRRNRV